MINNILFYYLRKNKTLCVKFELLIEYYSENFGIQVFVGDYTAFSIVLE